MRFHSQHKVKVSIECSLRYKESSLSNTHTPCRHRIQPQDFYRQGRRRRRLFLPTKLNSDLHGSGPGIAQRVCSDLRASTERQIGRTGSPWRVRGFNYFRPDAIEYLPLGLGGRPNAIRDGLWHNIAIGSESTGISKEVKNARED